MGDDDLWVMMTYEDHMMRQVSQVGSGQVMSGQVGPGRVRSVRSGQVVSGLVRSGRVRYIRALWPTRHQTFGSNIWHMFVEFAKRSIFESYHSRRCRKNLSNPPRCPHSTPQGPRPSSRQSYYRHLTPGSEGDHLLRIPRRH